MSAFQKIGYGVGLMIGICLAIVIVPTFWIISKVDAERPWMYRVGKWCAKQFGIEEPKN